MLVKENVRPPLRPWPQPSDSRADCVGRFLPPPVVMRRQVNLVAIAAMFAAGCGSAANIARRDGLHVRAEIIDSDANGLSVRDGNNGATARLDRSDIADVSHPGKTLMFVGAGLVGAWGIFMASPDFRHELANGAGGDYTVMARPITLLLTIPAAILIGAGSYRYVSSLRAARAFETARPVFEIAPSQPVAPTGPQASAPIPPPPAATLSPRPEPESERAARR